MFLNIKSTKDNTHTRGVFDISASAHINDELFDFLRHQMLTYAHTVTLKEFGSLHCEYANGQCVTPYDGDNERLRMLLTDNSVGSGFTVMPPLTKLTYEFTLLEPPALHIGNIKVYGTPTFTDTAYIKAHATNCSYQSPEGEKAIYLSGVLRKNYKGFDKTLMEAYV